MQLTGVATRVRLRAGAQALKSAPTVVLIGGLMEPPGYFSLLEAAIHRTCGFNTVHIRYPGRTARLEDNGCYLSDVLLPLRQRHYVLAAAGNAEAATAAAASGFAGGVHFVACGYGAAVLRSAMHHCNFSGCPARVVLVAPQPHPGGPLDRFCAGGVLRKELCASLLGKAGVDLLQPQEELAAHLPPLPSSFTVLHLPSILAVLTQPFAIAEFLRDGPPRVVPNCGLGHGREPPRAECTGTAGATMDAQFGIEWQPLPGDDEQWLAGGLVHPIQQPCPLWKCSQ